MSKSKFKLFGIQTNVSYFKTGLFGKANVVLVDSNQCNRFALSAFKLKFTICLYMVHLGHVFVSYVYKCLGATNGIELRAKTYFVLKKK